MAGFGSVGYMNTVMKNNRALLRKRDKFKNTLGTYSDKEKPEYNFPEASEFMLRNIRKKMTEEHKRKNRKLIAIMIIVVMTLIVSMIYFNNNYNTLFSI